MASSYTNGNVEAYTAVPQEEVPTKHTPAIRKIRASLLLHLVSFTAVILLIVQVVQLKDGIVQLRNEDTAIGGLGWYDGQHQPSQQADADTNTGPRSRRKKQDVEDSDTYSYLDYDLRSYDGLPSLHVAGTRERLEQSTEGWFTFHTSNDAGMLGRISHERLKFVHHQFIEITMAGYYFVYSQICYAGNGTKIGHEVVVRPDCGDGTEIAILESSALQATRPAKESVGGDSGYSGGVFYLAANDRVGVRPLLNDSTNATDLDHVLASYFGAFLLSKSSCTDVDPDLRRCP